jgi:hypothetical protein
MGVLMTHRLATLIVVAAAAACAPPETPTDGNFEDQSTFGTDSGVGDLGEINATVVPTIAGTWLMYSQASTCVDFVVQSETYKRSLYIIETTQDDSGVTQERFIACEIELSEVFGLLPSVTPAMLVTSYPIDTVGGLVTGTAVGGGYSSAPLSELWGLEMDDPVNDLFPTESDDSRIVDSDGDGNPGATLVFGNFCEAYIAQRTLSHYFGAYVTPDRIEGTIVSTSRQLTVDATQTLCASNYEIRSNGPRNHFLRIRVDGEGDSLNLDADGDGSVTCDEVVPFKDVLFERIPIDDDSCAIAG